MYHSHCGGATKCCGMALLLSASLAERDHRADQAQHGRRQRAEIAPEIVAARQLRVRCVGEPVHLGLVGDEEEGMEPAVLLVAVQARLRHALTAQLIQPGTGDVAHRAQVAELDRLGRTRLGARRRQVGLQPVVAERALAGEPGRLVEADDVIGAGGDAIAAAVAHVGLDVDRVELGPDDGVGGAHLHAARQRTMLADVAHHAPGDATLGRAALVELHVAPVLLVELAGVVVAVAELRGVSGELVPFLAGDLAGLAADAERRVGEEADRSRHGWFSYPIAIRLGTIFLKPRSLTWRSSGSATSSSTTGTAWGSLRRSIVIKYCWHVSQPSARRCGKRSASAKIGSLPVVCSPQPGQVIRW